ncbi:molybdenum cofactor biosynthesis protein MoaA [Candidatus Velamenicoccus archaeovorus]|uniref:Molybdenum cofactor biosynthesis protein MoaA n=1 Tax=Velamenicoccus archaeovorus TaxID=1930593 RepID=A0A410P698_VELA1|nr:molybdenum cofactor biosynthesis protein MoaA [Candidatus Velamenicoccus archaeovorus]
MTHTCSYLRLSLTDRCSFDCFYCGAQKKEAFLSDREYLDVGELERLARLFVGLGIRHVRLTGGEPLLRAGIHDIVRRLAAIKGLELVSMTTNGFALADTLAARPFVGLRRLNVSLDTLQRGRFRSLTGVDGLERVLEGIRAARQNGLTDVRINVLLVRGFNDDEIASFVRFGLERDLVIRFIEYFPTQKRRQAFRSLYVASADVIKIIETTFGPLAPEGSDPLSGPAQYYRLSCGGPRLGFISSVTHFFCSGCNRLRLTADGKLFPCLHTEHYADVGTLLRAGRIDDVANLIAQTAEAKGRYNKMTCSRFFEMSSIGG